MKLICAADKAEDEVESSAREYEKDKVVAERGTIFRGSTDKGLCRATRKRGWYACREKAPRRGSEDAAMEGRLG